MKLHRGLPAFLIFACIISSLALLSALTRPPTNATIAAETLLSESFDSGIPEEWEPFLNYHRLTPEQWYWENGQVKFHPQRGGEEAHDAMMIYTEGYAWHNYTVEADFSGDHAGIWFRTHYQESPVEGQWVTGYYAAFTSKEVRLWKIQTPDNCVTDCDKPQYLYHFANPTKIASSSHSFSSGRAKIELNEANIKISVNGTEVINHTDGDFPNGTIGFFSYKRPAAFDNVVVTGSATSDPTPPQCNLQNDTELKAFKGVRIYLDGSRASDPETGIKSGKWEIYDNNGTKVKTVDNINAYPFTLPVGRYSAKLTVTNGAGQTATCDQNLGVYDPEGFNGTVTVQEVGDYSIPSYTGQLYADNNPKRAIIVSWAGKNYRFVFWHEASYVPYWEFPNGSGANYQFFEGAHGSGELFNQYGRKDENSNVEIVQDDDKLVILKWWYYDVNKDSGERVGFAEEYFYFFPNGLILREQKLNWGESFEPMEIMIINPKGNFWWDNIPKSGDKYHMSQAVDIYSGETRDHWAQRTGNHNRSDYSVTGAGEGAIEDAAGVLMRSYLSNYPDPYIIYGNNSFVEQGDIKELGNWLYCHFVHWPIGWLNSEWKKGTVEEIQTYPTHTSTLGTNIIGSGPYYWLIGVSDAEKQNLIDQGKEWLSSPFYAPCSSAECDIEDLPEGPEPPSPPEGQYLHFDESSNTCKGYATPQATTECEEMSSLTLKPGWNFLALPKELAETTTYWLAKQSKKSGSPIDKISVWTENSKFESVIQEGDQLYGNPTDINGTIPLFCSIGADAELEDFPYPSGTGRTSVNLNEGWNTVVVRRTHVSSGMKSTKFLETKVQGLAGGQSYNRRQISYFDASSQRWHSHVYDGGELFGSEFMVSPDNAYFVYLEK